MSKWILAAVGVPVVSVAISAGTMALQNTPPPPMEDLQTFERRRQFDREYEPVTLIRLLADPERYDGRKVLVQGFVTLGFEDSGLYLDKDAYLSGLQTNAVLIHPPEWLQRAQARRLHRTYAAVAGTFEGPKPGRHSLYSGTLIDLRLIGPTFKVSDYYQWRLREDRAHLSQNLLSGWCLSVVGWTGLGIGWALTRRSA